MLDQPGTDASFVHTRGHEKTTDEVAKQSNEPNWLIVDQGYPSFSLGKVYVANKDLLLLNILFS